jgi:hypothetical protein
MHAFPYSHHGMWCWWCYRSSVSGVCSAVRIWRQDWCCGLLCHPLWCCCVLHPRRWKRNLHPRRCIIAYRFGGGDCVAPSKISAKRFNANFCSSPTWQNGAAGCGCNNAWVSSLAAWVASSCVERNGNLNFYGKNSTVLTIRSPLVLLIYTV